MFGFVGDYIDAGNFMSAPDGGLGGRLRELPAFEPPAGGWLALERRRRHSRSRTTQWAMAASFTVAAIVGVGVLGLKDNGGAGNDAAGTSELASRSQHLDRLLAQAHLQPASFDTTQVAQRADLERQLALVDLQINYADSGTARTLWQNRLSLMKQLVAAHGEDTVVADSEAVPDYVEY